LTAGFLEAAQVRIATIGSPMVSWFLSVAPILFARDGEIWYVPSLVIRSGANLGLRPKDAESLLPLVDSGRFQLPSHPSLASLAEAYEGPIYTADGVGVHRAGDAFGGAPGWFSTDPDSVEPRPVLLPAADPLPTTRKEVRALLLDDAWRFADLTVLAAAEHVCGIEAPAPGHADRVRALRKAAFSAAGRPRFSSDDATNATSLLVAALQPGRRRGRPRRDDPLMQRLNRIWAADERKRILMQRRRHLGGWPRPAVVPLPFGPARVPTAVLAPLDRHGCAVDVGAVCAWANAHPEGLRQHEGLWRALVAFATETVCTPEVADLAIALATGGAPGALTASPPIVGLTGGG
jgi:hypothetical protein